MKRLIYLALAGSAAGACGDNLSGSNPDAPPTDAAPDASNPFAPVPFSVPLSAAGPDQLQSVTAAPGGGFYAAGFSGLTLTDPRLLTVVKLSPTGLDTSFGTMGVVKTAVAFLGGSGEASITTQPDGKIIVSGTVANATNAADRDIAIVRLLATGAIDTTFGTDGVATINLNDAHDTGTALVGLDAARGVAADANGIYVLGVSRGLGTAAAGGPRLDTDFTVAKVTLAGVVDTTFGTDGQFRLDIQESNATARGLRVLADGKLLVGGYANSPGLGTTQPVVLKLTAAGALDTTFAGGGVFHDTVLAIQTEVYNFAVHGDKIVTAGYGRNTGTANDWVSLRFDLNTGARDTSWGGAPNGAMLVDPSGTMLGSNCRNAVGLPGGKTILIGSTGPSNMPAQDAALVILAADGKVDTSYGDGIHLFPLGANGNDQFWGGAVSGNSVAIVGYKGGGATPTPASNDDAYGVVFELRAQ